MSVQLHIRSCYSLLESTIRPLDLVKKAKSLGYQSLALTDHNVMHGVNAFFRACNAENIKPIIGLEVDCKYRETIKPFLLLAKNNEGYQNLMKLSSIACSGDHYCTVEELNTYRENCFLIIYGEGGIPEPFLKHENVVEIEECLNLMKQDLKDFYLALSYNDAPYWKRRNELLKDISSKMNIKTIALNKTYYLNEDDAFLYKCVQGISSGRTLNDKTLTILNGRFLRSPSEMEAIYAKDDLIETDFIASNCNVDLNIPKASLPKFPTPDGVSSADYLKQLSVAGLKKRLSNHVPKIYQERLKYELDVILKMHFEDYFLIVWDFIRFARKENIFVGPGRGSAAGSLVAYCLGITHMDPLEYNLLFERFLNPERVSMPDIDTDFPDNRRDEVIQYVYTKYGSNHIAHIITFGTLGAKQVIRDMGRVMAIPLRDVDMLCKLIPNTLKITLDTAYKTSPRLKQAIDSDKRFQELYANAMKLEGLPRHSSTHAAGIVMSDIDLNQIVPTIQLTEDMLSTQYTNEYLEDLGLIKMDFLGLRNLTIIDDIVQEVRKREPDFNIMRIPLDDSDTFKIIKGINTAGVFQLESDGMKNLLKKMQPDNFNDIVATIALFRPGPMENIPLYIEAKHNPKAIQYIVPCLEPILKDTYGIMIYQEQVMQTAQIVAGFSLARADVLRKAMSKKKVKDLEILENEFIGGCLKNGYTIEIANQLYALILKFAGYGFNKSHSVCYGFIAYQTAYLKAHYPLVFYKSLLDSVIGDDNKSAEYIEECRKSNVKVLYPSINLSGIYYQEEGNALRFPLFAIKNIGFQTVQDIVNERDKRPYADFYDFVARVSVLKVNRKVIENLIDAGALDEFKVNRKSLKASLDDALSFADLVRIEVGGQTSIDLGLVSKPILVSVKEDFMEKSENERNVFGFYLGNHPIVELKQRLQIHVDPLIKQKSIGSTITGFACITRVKQHRTKKGDMMAFVALADETADLDLVVMPNLYSEFGEQLIKGNYLYFNGKIDKENSCLASKIKIMSKK